MTLSLRDLVRSLLFHGSRSNGNGNGLAHERVSEALLRKSSRIAKIVLFVDDEPAILSMRRLVFEALGYSVLTAISGEEALEALELHQVDAVVLDYLMPGMDGEETARRIRKWRSDIPIILSSGCLTVPERVLELVTVAVEKAARPEALIETLEQQFHPLLQSTLNGDREARA
jgi:CheY-like chemotaxis protein